STWTVGTAAGRRPLAPGTPAVGASPPAPGSGIGSEPRPHGGEGLVGPLEGEADVVLGVGGREEPVVPGMEPDSAARRRPGEDVGPLEAPGRAVRAALGGEREERHLDGTALGD